MSLLRKSCGSCLDNDNKVRFFYSGPRKKIHLCRDCYEKNKGKYILNHLIYVWCGWNEHVIDHKSNAILLQPISSGYMICENCHRDKLERKVDESCH